MVKNIFKKVSFTIILSLFSLILFAQKMDDSTGASMEDVMRSHDKIYVVMAVCVTILVVLFFYLIRIDRKISGVEKNSNAI